MGLAGILFERRICLAVWFFILSNLDDFVVLRLALFIFILFPFSFREIDGRIADVGFGDVFLKLAFYDWPFYLQD